MTSYVRRVYCGDEVNVIGVFLEHLYSDHEQVLEEDVRGGEVRQLAHDVEQSSDVLAVLRTDRDGLEQQWVVFGYHGHEDALQHALSERRVR